MKTFTITMSDAFLRDVSSYVRLVQQLGHFDIGSEVLDKLIHARSGEKLYLCLIEDAEYLAKINNCEVKATDYGLEVTSKCKYNSTKVTVEHYGQLRLAIATVLQQDCEKGKDGDR